MDVRNRMCKGSIKIGVIELYSNGKEQAFKPFPMSAHPTNQSFTDHADNVIKIIRYYVPNADIFLVPPSLDSINYLIANDVKLVNISLDAYATTYFEKLSEKAFIVVSAGNDGEEGESGVAQIVKACCVGAVDLNLQPQTYSSYGKGAVKTCAIVGDPKYTGSALFGTSFASPIVTGLMGQWYIWYFDCMETYPSIAQSNDFVITNSHDIFDDDFDLRTGYGLLRLPKKFKACKYGVNIGTNIANVTKFTECQQPVYETISLMVAPTLQNGRTIVGASDITDMCNMSRYWNAKLNCAEYGKMK